MPHDNYNYYILKKNVRVWNFKMGGVQVFDLKYIDVLLFYSVEILNTKSLGSRFQPNIQSIMNSIICRDGYYTCDIILYLHDFLVLPTWDLSSFAYLVCDTYCLMHFYFLYARAKEAKTFHQCTTTQAKANIFKRYWMDTKDKKGFEKMLIIMVTYLLSNFAPKHTEKDVKKRVQAR